MIVSCFFFLLLLILTDLVVPTKYLTVLSTEIVVRRTTIPGKLAYPDHYFLARKYFGMSDLMAQICVRISV